MSEEEKIKRILTTTGYTTELNKHTVLFYIEELQQRIDKAIKLLQLPLVYETNNIEDLERTNLTRINELLEILKGAK